MEVVSEAAVVGIPDEIKGETPYAFVITRSSSNESDDEIRTALNSHVSKAIAKFAVPKDTIVVSGLPKTRSGKIMRRILRKIAATDAKNMDRISKELGDTSTLAEPQVLDDIILKRSQRP